jgi:Zn-dependent protease/CBS domain-containing protein
MTTRSADHRAGVLGLGRVGGVPVGLHWSVAVIVAPLAWALAASVLPAEVPDASLGGRVLAGVAAAVVFVATIMAHELAHVLVARRLGIGVRRVTLWIVGGTSEMSGEPRSPGALAAVAAVGPLTSAALGLGIAAAGTLGGPPLLAASLGWLGAVNVLLAVFNLLPAAPLDGGRVLEALVWRVTGSRDSGRRAATAAGRVLGLLLIAAGLLFTLRGVVTGLWLAAMGWFLGASASAERAGGRLLGALAGRTAADAASTPDPLLQAGWSVAAVIALLRERPSREAAFPVVGLDGDPVAVVTLRDLTGVAPDRRATTRVRDVGRSLSADRIVAADTPLERVVPLGALPGTDLLAVVADHGRLTGVVSAAGVARLVELSDSGR